MEAPSTWTEQETSLAIADAKERYVDPLTRDVYVKSVDLSASSELTITLTEGVRFPQYMKKDV